MARDVEAVLSAIVQTADGLIAGEAGKVDRERMFPRAGVDALGAAGGLGLVVGVDAGGAGGGLTALAAACEPVGEACASTGMVFLMHSVTAATIGAGGGARAADVLRGMAEGRTLGSLAFSERGTGAHFYSPELQATSRNGSVTVSGRKSFVTSGGHADVYLLLLQGAQEGTADAYLVGRDHPGVRFDGDWEGLGMAGNASVGLELADVELGEDARVGAPGEGLDLVFGAVAPFFLVGLAAVNVGIAAAAAKAATRHATGPPLPGRNLAGRGAVRAAPPRGHGHDRAGRTVGRPGGGPARRSGRRVGARRDHGGEGGRHRSGRRRDAASRSRQPAARATRRRCRSSAICVTRGPDR